mmetsp:Transcript_8283/g.51591  ORF Transcript_8283/g.51591 Transcript_8283/m.51591 type:complete len:245 (-) Transcript_8283:101-835(-)
MLPAIVGQQALLSLHERIHSIGCLTDRQLPISRFHKPHPSGAKHCTRCTRRLELGREVFVGSKALFNLLQEFACGLSAPVGRHRLPEKVVVPYLSCVVEHRCGLPVVPGRLHHFFQRQLLLWFAFDLSIEIVDVGLVMLPPVELQGALGHVRLERVQFVRRRFQRECCASVHAVSICLPFRSVPSRPRRTSHHAACRLHRRHVHCLSSHVHVQRRTLRWLLAAGCVEDCHGWMRPCTSATADAL